MRKTEIAMGSTLKLTKKEKQLNDRRNWRLLTENVYVVREKCEQKKWHWERKA